MGLLNGNQQGPNFVCNASFSLPFSSTASFYVMMKLFFLLMLSLPSKSLLFFLCIHFLLFLLFAFLSGGK